MILYIVGEDIILPFQMKKLLLNEELPPSAYGIHLPVEGRLKLVCRECLIILSFYSHFVIYMSIN